MLAVNEQEFELTDKDFKFIQWLCIKRSEFISRIQAYHGVWPLESADAP